MLLGAGQGQAPSSVTAQASPSTQWTRLRRPARTDTVAPTAWSPRPISTRTGPGA